MTKSKTLLVTGGSGFIGSWFIRFFFKSHSEWSIINLDKLTYAGNPDNNADYASHPKYKFIQGDICDATATDEAVKQCSAIVHFAAESHVDRSIDRADDFIVTNVLGTRTLLESARKHGVDRFLHVSTDEVYGSIEEGSVDENAPLYPNSPYSASKASSDLMVRSYWVTYDLPALIVRCTNTYGPYQFPEKVIPLFVTNLFENKSVPLYGKGLNKREWMYVEDTCKGIELVFDKGRDHHIYNISGGEELTNLELTHTILRVMGKEKNMIKHVPDRLGHDLRYAMNASKVRALGFRPQISFEKGLRQTIDWYLSNPIWWQKLKQDKFTVK